MVDQADLPSGTVTMLFSDIEGSTMLLTRLGEKYAEVLKGYRSVLRAAWGNWQGHEMGTEGDSFFVVFAAAGDAVNAANEAQRGLVLLDLPDDQRPLVRMGLHTGEPTVHDDGYVGLDVHRAARVSACAHGGQVVVTNATAAIVRSRLPESTTLKDLGWHRLKDIPDAEHLFQVVAPDRPSAFPPLRSLGAATSLPVPPTPVVGRDDELEALSTLLGRLDVRLVTLTGPGGTGKTRIALELARRQASTFPDGAYFVPLAAATGPETMRTTIAEVLDLPQAARTPGGLLSQLAGRDALLVLDNLEQLAGADRVVSDLLAGAPQLRIVATTRRPLHVAGEHEHAVPSLDLPEDNSLDAARRSGAVSLFVQHASMVRSNFALTHDNAADLIELCRKLDGLPLAIELIAARSKLLSPAAMIARLDQALEVRDTGVDRPVRQQTLRQTIAWSYDLLDPPLQRFFNRLGVFAGGADLEAVAVVGADLLDGADAVDMVAGLVDASLVTISESTDSEPRLGLLETLGVFARDQLREEGELDSVRDAHARHYLLLTRRLGPTFYVWAPGPQVLQARHLLELELDNLREALRWALGSRDEPGSSAQLGLALCAELVWFWKAEGYVAEGRRWLERAISLAGETDTAELAGCLTGIAELELLQGDTGRAHVAISAGVAMWRLLGDDDQLARALRPMAHVAMERDDLGAARRAAQEAVLLVTPTGDESRRAIALADLASVEVHGGRFDLALELYHRAIALHLETGTELAVVHERQNMATVMRQMKMLHEAHRLMWNQIPVLLKFASTPWLTTVVEDYGALLADLDAPEHAARLLGAADAVRERDGTPRLTAQGAEIGDAFARARTNLSPETWDLEYQLGRRTSLKKALADAHAACTPTK